MTLNHAPQLKAITDNDSKCQSRVRTCPAVSVNTQLLDEVANALTHPALVIKTGPLSSQLNSLSARPAAESASGGL